LIYRNDMLLKTADDIQALRVGGKRLAAIMKKLAKEVQPGVSTKDIDDLATKLIRAGGDETSLLNYMPHGSERPYPATICISVNDEVVHGIPTESPRIFSEGDIVSLDLVLTHDGRFVDMAITVPVGKVDQKAQELMAATKDALSAGIRVARAGNTIGDIGHAIQTSVEKSGFSVVTELGGHAVGHAVHEFPYVPNTGKPGKGAVLKPGMVLALEPIVNEGSPDLYLEDDGYTYKTQDGGRSAHFEHSIVITDGEPEILTV
jgi:methionyl aminopeptidase